MTALLAGLLLFLGIHLLSTRRAIRAGLIAKLGAQPFKGLYSLVAFAGLALVVYGFGAYRAGGYVDVWSPPGALRHLSLALLLPVFVLLAATYLPGWIKAKARHPMLLAIKLWAVAHLLANGDLGSMLLFGGFLLWAGYARATMRERERLEGTSAAVPAAFGNNDVIAVVVGLAAYAAVVLWLHPILIGVAVTG